MNTERVDEFDSDLIAERLLEIYDRTSSWLWFSTSLHPEFFGRDEIEEKITSIAESGVSIRILLDGQVEVEQVRDEVRYLFQTDNIEIKQIDEKIPHRVISDGEDLRLEKEHTLKEKGAPNLIAYDVDGKFSDAYKERFEEWWEESRSVEA